MSGPIGSQQWMYNASSEFYPYELNNSLKFEDGDSSYLSRTPASAGNRKTWTWSGWIKRAKLGAFQPFFMGGTATNDTTLAIDFTSSDQIRVTGYSTAILITTPVFRDTSSWYHVVVSFDTTNSTANNRVRIYVNGTEITVFGTRNNPSLNADYHINNNVLHTIGYQSATFGYGYFDGYITEVNFIDGLQLTPSSFGQTKEGIWVPKDPTGLTYGTNGFRLPFTETTSANGFNTVIATGNASTQSLDGVGFQPDLVWMKVRTNAVNHILYDSVRGVQKYLVPNLTDAEATNAQGLTSFDSDGFTLGSINPNSSTAYDFVAWCWDAGTGNAASNSDGTITSSVKANQDYGFSIVSYTGTGANATVGHGLSSAPKLILFKKLNVATSWMVYNHTIGNNRFLYLDQNNGQTGTDSSYFNDTDPTSTVINLGTYHRNNSSSEPYIAYCFADVSAYQKVGSYSGTGSSGNAITGVGFRPAWLMVKRTDSTGSWQIFDTTRDPSGSMNKYVYANLDNAEASDLDIAPTSDGFTVNSTNNALNNSSGTYIFLAIADTRDALFTSDASGNGNNWIPNDLQHSDVMPDTPTDGFAVLNNITSGGIGTLTEGNLQYQAASGQWESKISTLGVSSGKWYFEGTPTSGSTPHIFLGLINMSDTYLGQYLGYYGNTWGYYFHNGTKYNNASSSSYGSSVGVGDVVGVALDADAGTLTFYKNGVSQGVAYSGLSLGGGYDQEWFLGVSCYNSEKVAVNFGQDSSFNGIKVAQGNTDDNGKGDFFYAPPSGHLALCNANLPNPAIDPDAGDNPENYFNTALYTGNGGTQSITGVGFQPDWTWIKSRSAAYDHVLIDSVRGVEKQLISNKTDAETQDSGNGLISFDTDGFTVKLGTSTSYNNSSQTYAAWNWLAGGTGVTNNDGSIQSTVSANTEAGFSVVSYTGNGTGGATVGHGLGVAPDMIIVRNRDVASNFIVYHTANTSAPETDYLMLNSTAATDDTSSVWNDTAPTSSVFTVGNSSNTNGSSNNMIAYCFAEKKGYSKFGSYIGNSSADGPFVYTGFRPSFWLQKRTDSTSGGNWRIIDIAREPFNDGDPARLFPDSNSAEQSNTRNQELLSNGIKVRSSNVSMNASGSTYIYMAFAEQPFKYSNAR